MMNDDNKIHETYKILQRKYKELGLGISLPENTDPRKTYGWRYLVNFVRRMEQLEISEHYYPIVINAILEHAKRRGLLNRGFAVLNKLDIVDLVIRNLEKDISKSRQQLERVLASHNFIQKQQNQHNISDILSIKGSKNAYTNMTKWYEQGYLAPEYIALSKNCRRVLSTINTGERTIFPETIKLMKMRLQILSDNETTDQLKTALNDDLFTG